MNMLKNEIRDIRVVKSLIPQADPFVMVDKLLYYSEDKIISGFSIVEDQLFVEENLFTAPGLLENMAQTVALHTGYGYYLKNEIAPEGYIGAISKVNILALPKVGENLTTTVNILHNIMDVTLVEATVTSGDKVLAQSRMKTALAS